MIGQLRTVRVSGLFRIWSTQGGSEPRLLSSYETKPKSGWRKRPTVPRTQTVTNTQRKILSITMATYFQSSSTCERGRGHKEKCEREIPDLRRWEVEQGRCE